MPADPIIIGDRSPIQDEVDRITNTIVTELGGVDLESVLTVLCNLTGQVVCSLADGKPSGIQAHGNSVAENIKKAAIAKMIHDDDKRRGDEVDVVA